MTVGGNWTEGPQSPLNLSADSSLVVYKDFDMSPYSTANLQGSVTVFGTVNNTSGTGGAALLSNLTTFSGFYQTAQGFSSVVNGVLTAFGTGVNLQNGTLANNGVINGNLTMQGGTYGGNGTVNGNVSVLGANFSGNTLGSIPMPSMLTINGNFTQSGGTFQEMIGASTNSLLNVNGGVMLDPSAGDEAMLDIALLSGSTLTNGKTFDILNYLATDGLSGTFGNAPTSGFTMDGWNWGINYDASGVGGDDEVVLTADSQVVTATPEPSSLLLLALGFLGLIVSFHWMSVSRSNGQSVAK
jgi:hypothetical protein